MFNLVKKVMMFLCFSFLIFNCFSCYAANDGSMTFKQRLEKIDQENSMKKLNFVFYLDSEGGEAFEQKVLDEIVSNIQQKLPLNAALTADSQFLADFDLYRETKYDELLEKMQVTNPEFAVLGEYAETGKKVKLTKTILDNYFSDSEYDGMVLVRIDVVNTKATYNAWVGGIDTKAEMDITIRVYNKHTPKGYVFTTKQRVMGKSHATAGVSVQRAARKAIPQALNKINVINVE